MPRAPKLVDIIAAVPEEFREALLPRLRAKPVRTASGIAVVAVMSKPHRCPHIATTGNICVYCPGGPDSDFEYSTQSYTGYEPTSMRAIRARCTLHCYDASLHAQMLLLGCVCIACTMLPRSRMFSSLHIVICSSVHTTKQKKLNTDTDLACSMRSSPFHNMSNSGF